MNDLRFGCIPSGKQRVLRFSRDRNYAPYKEVDWVQTVVPSDFQQEGSCVARSTCGLAECMIRVRDGVDALQPGEQLDAESLYWFARQKYFGDQEDKGLMEHHALECAIHDFGIFPPDTRYEEVQPTLADVVEALSDGPLLQVHLVGKNWENPNTSNGYISYQAVTPFTSPGYHMTLMIGYQHRDGQDLILFQNSWGPWGWHGLGIMSWDTWWAGYRWAMAGPLKVKFGPQWNTFHGWKNHIIRAPVDPATPE